MPAENTLPVIEANRIDYIVTALKSVAGLLPFVGPLVAEAIGALIPHQRLDRLARYVTALEQTLRTNLIAAEIVENLEADLEPIRITVVGPTTLPAKRVGHRVIRIGS